MPSSRSLLSYRDVKEPLDRVIETERGIRIRFADEKAAKNWLFRANVFRGLDRRENMKLFPEPTHSLHGRSVYDTLRMSQRNGTVLVEIIKLGFEIEELEEN